MLSNCGAGEDSWESVGQQGDQTSQSKREINPEYSGRTNAEAEALILWPPDANSWLIGKDPDAGKDWGQEEMTEDELVGWHHWLNGHESEQIPGDREGQGSLVCCSLWGSQRVRHDLLTEQQQLSFCRLGFCFLIYRDTNTWSNGQIWPWNAEWSRAKTNRVLPRERTGHSKHSLPTTQEKTVHTDITRWSTPKSDWLYSLQPKMEKLYTVSKNKTRSWLWLRSWTSYCQIQT